MNNVYLFFCIEYNITKSDALKILKDINRIKDHWTCQGRQDFITKEKDILDNIPMEFSE